MYFPEKGVLRNSNSYFYTASNIAKSIFFYLTCSGEFFCENDIVRRDNFYSYLILYVRKETAASEKFQGKAYPAVENDVVFLNCHKPHMYKSNPDWEILFIHFDGNSSRHIFDLLYNPPVRGGAAAWQVGGRSALPRLDRRRFQGRQTLAAGHRLQLIDRILSEIMIHMSVGDESSEGGAGKVIDAVTYIETNLEDKITIEDIASCVNMSPFHFSRLFKKETGYSPYEFIIKTRIGVAKMLLKKTEEDER